jgi:hypothetical protein
MREKQQYIERTNIPVSNSLLHKQEYNNTLKSLRVHYEKRRATSEKNNSNNKLLDIYDNNIVRIHSYHTSYEK